MISEYIFSEVKNKIWYYASVTVLVEYDSQNSCVFQQMDCLEFGNRNAHGLKPLKSWIDAAVEGVQQTLTYITNKENKTYRVVIRNLIGTDCDTTEDVVMTAAAIATWRAIKLGNSEVKPLFDGSWYVRFPEISYLPEK